MIMLGLGLGWAHSYLRAAMGLTMTLTGKLIIPLTLGVLGQATMTRLTVQALRAGMVLWKVAKLATATPKPALQAWGMLEARAAGLTALGLEYALQGNTAGII